jgi:hypothetical protein
MNVVPNGGVASQIWTAQNLSPLNRYSLVVQTSPEFAMGKRKMPKLMSYLSRDSKSGGVVGGSAIKVDKSGNRSYTVYRKGNEYPTILSAGTPTLSNGNTVAVVTVSNSDFRGYPKNSLVRDNVTNTNAIVTSAENGVLTLRFRGNTNGATAFTASDFVTGNYVLFVGYTGGVLQYEVPQFDYPYPDGDVYTIGQFNDGCTILAEDANFKTWFNWMGKPYYALGKEMNTINRMESAMYNMYLGDTPAVASANNPTSQSFLSQIKQYGGLLWTSTPNTTVEEFEDKVIDFKRTGVSSDTIYIFCGLAYFSKVSRALRPYIETAGNNSVLKKVMGLDIMEFNIAGSNIVLIPEMYFENVNQVGGNKSNTAYWISGDGAQDEQGNYLPPVFDAYYLQDGIKRNVNRGKMDEFGVHQAESSNPQPYTQINFDLDGAKILANPKSCAYEG